MSLLSPPAIALPEPLRAAEIPSFTNYSVVVRLPDIAQRTLKENDFSPETVTKIEALIAEIPEGAIRPLDVPQAPDAAQWANYTAHYEGLNWLEVPWFFAEEYFYMRILEATGYFGEGEDHGRDPYAYQKRMGLESTRQEIVTLAENIEHALRNPERNFKDTLNRLLLVNLWGNQNDLSMWPVGMAGDNGSVTGGTARGAGNGSAKNELLAAQEHVITDDLDEAVLYITWLDPAHAAVDILLDNAGYELVTDLALADYLLHSGHASLVTLHAKSHPVFVSDALEKDIHDTLDFLAFEGHPAVNALAVRLRSALINEKLRLRHHPFWTSPLPAWEMPPELAFQIGQSRLLIAKGDANYRRLLGDRHWPIDLPFGRVVDYLPSAVLALRTLKSEIAVGIDPTRIPTSDKDWMIDGRWGLIQFTSPRK